MPRFCPAILVAVLAAMALGGCAPSPSPVVEAPRPVLPAAPAMFGRPVTVAPPRAGEDVRAYAVRERIGRLEANARLRDDAAFWRDVVGRYAPAE